MRAVVLLALANARRVRLRSLIAALSVAITTGAAMVGGTALGRVMKMRALNDGLADGRVPLISAAVRQPLPLSFADRLAKLPRVKWVYWIRGTVGTLDGGGTYDVLAVSTAWPDRVPHGVIDADPAELAAWKVDPRGVFLSPALMAALRVRVGDPVVLHTFVGDLQGTVDGLVRGEYGKGTMLALPRYDLVAQVQKKQVATQIMAGCDRADGAALVADVEREFASEDIPILTMPFEKYMQTTFYGPQSMLPALVVWLAASTGVLAVLINLSAGLALVGERGRELLVLRWLGLGRRTLAAAVAVETLLVALAGGIGGGLVTVALFHSHGVELGDLMLGDVTVGPPALVLGVAVAAVVGALSAIAPALAALRFDPRRAR